MMMLIPRLAAITILGLVSVTNGRDSHPDMYGVLNILYIKADVNMDMEITEAELGQLFNTMDTNNDGRVNRAEFSAMWLPMTGHSADVGHAYFMLWDGNSDGELDDQDDARIYTIFDLDGDGTVQAQEFSTEFQVIYHRVPFVVLFDREARANGNIPELNQQQFSKLFNSLQTEGDGSITEVNFNSAWLNNRFGNVEDAKQLFSNFDTDKDGQISTSEVASKFHSLDKNGNGLLGVREAYVLGDIVTHNHS